MKTLNASEKKTLKQRHEFQDLVTSFTSALDESMFLLEDIEGHEEFHDIELNSFRVLQELMTSSRDLSLTILKELHFKRNKKTHSGETT